MFGLVLPVTGLAQQLTALIEAGGLVGAGHCEVESKKAGFDDLHQPWLGCVQGFDHGLCGLVGESHLGFLIHGVLALVRYQTDLIFPLSSVKTTLSGVE